MYSYYGNKVKPKQAYKMLLYCLECERENKLYQAWVALYPHMGHDDFVSFEDFIKREESYIPHENLQDLTIEMDKVIENYERGFIR